MDYATFPKSEHAVQAEHEHHSLFLIYHLTNAIGHIPRGKSLKVGLRLQLLLAPETRFTPEAATPTQHAR